MLGYSTLVRWAISFPTWKWKDGFSHNGQRRMVNAVAGICERLNIKPVHLVDCGAYDSEWALAFLKFFPQSRITSIEPLHHTRTIGEVHKFALSDVGGKRELEYLGKKSRVVFRRFDSLGIRIDQPAVLKIDCEQDTAKALRGCGKELDKFAVVVVEMWNDYKSDSGYDTSTKLQAQVWETMLQHDFKFAQVVDVPYYPDGIYSYDIAFYKTPMLSVH